MDNINTPNKDNNKTCTGIKTTKEVVLYALLAGILVAAKEILALVPGIEIVTVMLIVYTVALGLKALYPTYVFVILEIMLYGFGTWSIGYLYIWGVLVLVTHLLLGPEKEKSGSIIPTIIAGLFGLFFGALGAIPVIFLSGMNSAIAYFISGISFDLAHFAGNVVTTLILYKPLYKITIKCRNQFFADAK